MTSPPATDASVSGRSGHYAGPATRLAAWIVDLFVSHGFFALIAFTVVAIVAVFTGRAVRLRVPAEVGAPADLVWLFLYFFISWATVGKTPGMTLVGLQVVQRDGSKLHPGKAAVRTLVFPLSFVLGLGFIGVIVGREHRALHDVAAGTVVVFE
jgi:uncharacterized RDD family membrane protein YckC